MAYRDDEKYLESLRAANAIAAGTGTGMSSLGAPGSSGVTGAATGAALAGGNAAGGTGNLGGSPMGNVAGGAATGAAVGGPYGAVIGAAVGLLSGLIAQKDAEKARKAAYEQEQQRSAQERLYGMQARQVNTAGEMGNREQNAIQQLMGVIARSQR